MIVSFNGKAVDSWQGRWLWSDRASMLDSAPGDHQLRLENSSNPFGVPWIFTNKGYNHPWASQLKLIIVSYNGFLKCESATKHSLKREWASSSSILLSISNIVKHRWHVWPAPAVITWILTILIIGRFLLGKIIRDIWNNTRYCVCFQLMLLWRGGGRTRTTRRWRGLTRKQKTAGDCSGGSQPVFGQKWK